MMKVLDAAQSRQLEERAVQAGLAEQSRGPPCRRAARRISARPDTPAGRRPAAGRQRGEYPP